MASAAKRPRISRDVQEAITSGDAVALRRALAGPVIDVNQVDDKKRTPLWHAATGGNAELVSVLIGALADVNLRDNTMEEGFPPICKAAEGGHMEAMRLLLQAGAIFNEAPDSGFTFSTTFGWDGWTPLYMAVRNGHANAVTVLLEAKANIDVQTEHGETPLLIACIRRRHALARVLIDAKADVNLATHEYCDTPLPNACASGGDVEIVRLLLAQKADVDARGGMFLIPTLFVAVDDSCNDVVRLLVASDANVNITTGNGCTPLQVASQYANVDIMQEVLDARATWSINQATDNGSTALSSALSSLRQSTTATRYDLLRAVELLIDADADVNQA